MEWEAVIGLEVHVQVRTETKMFCSCPNLFAQKPNSSTCPVCLGYPGVLPVPNREAINKTIRAGFMIDAQINQFSKFDRKAYWYPDMPKNYQITQYDLPFCEHGHLMIEGKALTGDVEKKRIGITRIHLEEDVGKSTHHGSHSTIDYNRAGKPLMEIVSEPDLSTSNEAYVYLTALRQAMQYADISDCDMEKGQMRCDVNISMRPVGQQEFNTKVEIKNLNSFKAVHHSIEYEWERQIDIYEEGGEIIQQTRGWNDAAGETYLMREKEGEDDYRYFPEPDMMPVTTTDEELDTIRELVPETPAARRQRYVKDYTIPEYDAQVLCLDKAIADFYEETVKAGADTKKASNWIMTDVLRFLSDEQQTIDDCQLTAENLAALLGLIDKNVISGNIAKKVFEEMFTSGKAPADIVKEQGLEQDSDTDSIQEFIDKAVADNPQAVEDFKAGEDKALNFLLGQVMKNSKGKANPGMVRQSLIDQFRS